jgi:hypothetical protein
MNYMTIHYELNNGYREIQMGMSDFPTDVEPSRMGYSIGRVVDGV